MAYLAKASFAGVMAATLISCSTLSHQLAPSRAKTVYASADRSFVVTSSGSSVFMGKLYPPSFNDISEGEGIAESLVNRHVSGIRCISFGHRTFAITTAPTPGQTFQCNGVRFTILECRPAARSCGRAVIVAECPDYAQGRCFEDKKGGRPPVETYRYVFEQPRGVTEIEFDLELAQPENVLTLQRGRGFLGEPE